jgi:hypothetical protein
VREGSSQLQSTQMVSVQRDGITPSLCRSVARFVAATSAIGASATSRLGATNDRSEAHNGHSLEPTITAEVAPNWSLETTPLNRRVAPVPLHNSDTGLRAAK